KRATSACRNTVRTSPITIDTDYWGQSPVYFMRIAIYGSGGVGGYFGARLAAAGNDVHFIARGAHLAAMREQGLRVESGLGNLHVAQPQVYADPAAIGAVDFVLLAV